MGHVLNHYIIDSDSVISEPLSRELSQRRQWSTSFRSVSFPEEHVKEEHVK